MRYFQKFQFLSSGKNKQNPKTTSLVCNIQNYFAATMKTLEKIQSILQNVPQNETVIEKSHVVKQKMNICEKTCSDAKI